MGALVPDSPYWAGLPGFPFTWTSIDHGTACNWPTSMLLALPPAAVSAKRA